MEKFPGKAIWAVIIQALDLTGSVSRRALERDMRYSMLASAVIAVAAMLPLLQN